MRLLASLLALAACAGEPEPYIRACNDAGAAMSQLTWRGYTAPSLDAGACTDYEQPETPVYRYTYVRFSVDGTEYTLMPIDYVGEHPLDDGHWSYRLAIAGGRTAGLQLARDE